MFVEETLVEKMLVKKVWGRTLSVLLLSIGLVGCASNKEDGEDNVSIQSQTSSIVEPLTPTETEQIQVATEDIISATLNSDSLTIVGYVPDSMVKLSGGKDRLFEALAKTFAVMDEQGLTIEEFTYQLPSEKFSAEDSVFVLIPTFSVIQTPDLRMKSKSFLVGSLDQNGKRWTFVDAAGIKSRRALEQLYPNYPEDREVPRQTVEIIE